MSKVDGRLSNMLEEKLRESLQKEANLVLAFTKKVQ